LRDVRSAQQQCCAAGCAAPKQVKEIMAKPASDTKAALSRCLLFKTLTAAALAQLAERARTFNVRRGARIYGVGERCPGVYIVLSGRVMLSVGAQPDANKVVDLIGTGGHFGLATAILDGPQTVAADALIDTVLVMVPRAILLEMATGHAELGLQIAAALSRGIVSLTDDIEAYSLHSGRQRVANYLLRVAAANATRSRPFPLPAKKSIIASRLGLTPEYFSRMLHDLITAHAIVVEGRQITILDPALLRGAGHTEAVAA
jgi:CRP/FNR family transcriptional regulator, dissimilatory nitrate respiration regulator